MNYRKIQFKFLTTKRVQSNNRSCFIKSNVNKPNPNLNQILKAFIAQIEW